MRSLRNSSEEDPLKRIVDFIHAAERGDFSQTLPVVSGGDLGELERSLNRLVSEIRDGRDRSEEHRVIQKELQVSRLIQSNLLPKMTPKVEGLEISSLYRPAELLGGDYFDFIEVDSDHLGIAVADVSGKSVSGAILMSMARNILRSEAMEILSPAEVVRQVERLIVPTMMPEFFVTMVYAVLNKRTMKLSLVNAGHPPLLLYRNGDHRVEWVNPKGSALGLSRVNGKPASFEEEEITLKPGDLAFFYTDGVVDSESPKGDFFQRERLSEIALAAGARGGAEFLKALEVELSRFNGDVPQRDDITAVVIRREAL